MAKKTNDLSHTKWMCKYHIVFTPKYRRKIIYNQYKADIRDIIKQLCSYKGVEIIEGHLMPDHIHMLVSIPPKYSVSSFMGYLKGKSALMTVSYTHLDVYKRQVLCRSLKIIIVTLPSVLAEERSLIQQKQWPIMPELLYLSVLLSHLQMHHAVLYL